LDYQGNALTQGAKLLDSGSIKVPGVQVLPWTIASLKQAHEEQASGKAIGKIVLTRETSADLGRVLGGA